MGLAALSLRILLIFLLLSFNACGKKGEPSYRKLIIPEPVSGLSYLLRPEGVVLRWEYSGSKEGIYFEIYRKGHDGVFTKIGETGESFFNDIPVSNGEGREYSIVSVSEDGFRKEQGLTIPPSMLPEPPSSFNFRIVDDGVLLSWNPSEGCLYNLYRIDHEKETIINREPINDSFFKDAPGPSIVNIYRLRCKRDSIEGYPAEVVVRPEDYIPSKPEGLRFVYTDGKIMLTWRENSEKWIRGYRIYRSYGGEFTLIGESPYPIYMDEPGEFKQLFYKVTALGPSLEGPFSEVITIFSGNNGLHHEMLKP